MARLTEGRMWRPGMGVFGAQEGTPPSVCGMLLWVYK